MAVVLVGGIKSISSFAEKVVLLMALAYVIAQHLYSGKVRQQHPARLCDDF
ncbi:MAG: hypothetical protein ACLTG0_08555 [Oscillibacter sp.]